MRAPKNQKMVLSQYRNQALTSAIAIALDHEPEKNTNTLETTLPYLLHFGDIKSVEYFRTGTPKLSCIQHKLELPTLTQEELDTALPKARTLIQEKMATVGPTIISNVEACMAASQAPSTSFSGGEILSTEAGVGQSH